MLNSKHYFTLFAQLSLCNNVETDPSNVSELFNDYFSRVATDIGFDDGITSTSDAVDKYNSHPKLRGLDAA